MEHRSAPPHHQQDTRGPPASHLTYGFGHLGALCLPSPTLLIDSPPCRWISCGGVNFGQSAVTLDIYSWCIQQADQWLDLPQQQQTANGIADGEASSEVGSTSTPITTTGTRELRDWATGDPPVRFHLSLDRCMARLRAMYGKHVRQVANHLNQSVAVLSSGDVYQWRYMSPASGGGAAPEPPSPCVSPSVAPHTSHSHSQKETGVAFGWEPVLSLQRHSIVQVACGGTFALAVSETGAVFSWGESRYGGLGLGPEVLQKRVSKPTVLNSLVGRRVRSVVCGFHHCIATVRDDLYSWGCGLDGRLFNETSETTQSWPQLVSFHRYRLTGPTNSAGTAQPPGVSSTQPPHHHHPQPSRKTLSARWRATVVGQSSPHHHDSGSPFGGASPTSHAVLHRPPPPPPRLGFKRHRRESSAATVNETEASTMAGSSQGPSSEPSTPRADPFHPVTASKTPSGGVWPVPPWPSGGGGGGGGRGAANVGIAAVRCGYDHTVLLLTDGRIFAAGSNQLGQLGLPPSDHDSAISPVQVAIDSSADVNREHGGLRHTACGPYHTAVAYADGSVYVWGYDLFTDPRREPMTAIAPPFRLSSFEGSTIADLACGPHYVMVTVSTQSSDEDLLTAASSPGASPRPQRPAADEKAYTTPQSSSGSEGDEGGEDSDGFFSIGEEDTSDDGDAIERHNGLQHRGHTRRNQHHHHHSHSGSKREVTARRMYSDSQVGPHAMCCSSDNERESDGHELRPIPLGLHQYPPRKSLLTRAAEAAAKRQQQPPYHPHAHHQQDPSPSCTRSDSLPTVLVADSMSPSLPPSACPPSPNHPGSDDTQRVPSPPFLLAVGEQPRGGGVFPTPAAGQQQQQQQQGIGGGLEESAMKGLDGYETFRPPNLPPKPSREAVKHMKEVQEVERRYKAQLQLEARERAMKQQAEDKKELRLTRHTTVWLQELLPTWTPGTRPSPRMDRFWRQGLPPKIREIVWPLALGNALRITPELFDIHLQKARRARVRARDGEGEGEGLVVMSRGGGGGKEASIHCIPFDLPRTFPTLAFFHQTGPLHDHCRDILEAWTFYRPDIGYVQGMSYLAAMLLIFMQPLPAFICLCNLLNRPSLLGLYQMDPAHLSRRYRIFASLLYANLPDLHRHWEAIDLSVEMFLLEWFLTLYAKVLPLDLASIVWDTFFLDGEVTLFVTAVAICKMLQPTLVRCEGLDETRRLLGRLREVLTDESEFTTHLNAIHVPETLAREVARLGDIEFGIRM
ncbi:unnamed protein product [Vitrella brassicaformis CCMP3155]|uniref:Rab-GAP TBC domain-containing protein n=4 Tax=Vitrella brassicaformis TaxID=1169539 RepID=A0A0G4EWZ6_VITBC|nr:unnamed protein product [Vitrella brassicaformis CCMP3155]|eukprot:CEM02604.1 unnamed protein product [Vitrella brassicaformis CCMP3155]